MNIKFLSLWGYLLSPYLCALQPLSYINTRLEALTRFGSLLTNTLTKEGHNWERESGTWKYMILKPIRIFCVFLQLKKKEWHPTRKPLPINRKAESGKTEWYLIFKPFCFRQPGTRYQLTEWQNWERQNGTQYLCHSVFTINRMTELGETEWYMILMSFCFLFFYDLKTTEWHPNSDPFC